MSIKKEVNKLIKRHKTNNPFYIAKSMGILIEFADLGDTLGFYFKSNRIKVININNRISTSMQRFVCSHELGHSILHPRANTPFLRKSTFVSIEKIEVEASTFAVELLMPDSLLRSFSDTELTISAAAKICGVPKEFCHLKKGVFLNTT